MSSKSNTQAMETEKIPTSFGAACNSCCCGTDH